VLIIQNSNGREFDHLLQITCKLLLVVYKDSYSPGDGLHFSVNVSITFVTYDATLFSTTYLKNHSRHTFSSRVVVFPLILKIPIITMNSYRNVTHLHAQDVDNLIQENPMRYYFLNESDVKTEE
jgi:hypothetical protein